MKSVLLLMILASAILVSADGFAQVEPKRFALIIGANLSVDKDLAPLRFADDDAARYFDLFKLLGVKTLLLADIDADTKRLHPEASAAAKEATKGALYSAVEALRVEVKEAKEAGSPTEVHVIFAGHGNRNGTQGYLTLRDLRLTGTQFFDDVVLAIDADKSHVVIDACYSFLLTYERGPGGRRREVHRFSTLSRLAERNVGVMLSTSSAARSHEWSAVSSGVFSHGVRSGMYGGADVNLDGKITYRELAAFVFIANQAIDNPNYRPQIFVQPTSGGPEDGFITLNPMVGQRHIVLNSGGHFSLETEKGVRLLDVHAAEDQKVRLIYPSDELLFLQPMANATEASASAYRIPPQQGVVELLELKQDGVLAAARGASSQSFEVLFKKPSDAGEAANFSFVDVAFPDEPPYVPTPGEAALWSLALPGMRQRLQGRSGAGWLALSGVAGLGVVTLALGGTAVALNVGSSQVTLGGGTWVNMGEHG
ncbi:MAG: hypothetical protein GY822_24305 [Deltaproteobacteria bacterium]|nr:hypothetical protein [Deltaproteobacteria bacterium]